MTISLKTLYHVMKYKKIILVISYSILFIPIFGLLLLDNSTKSNISVFICLIYTFTSSYFVSVEFKDFKFSKFLIVSFPSLYFVLILLVKDIDLFIFLNPILIANIFLFSAVFIFKKLNLKKVYFFYLFFAYLYAFVLFEFWEDSIIIKDTFENSVEKKYIRSDLNLKNYNFVSYKNDTVKINSQKLVLIETWNENCPPCIKSIKELESTIDSLENNLEHYYLYESNFYQRKNNFQEIINFNHIKQKSKILIDYDQSFFKASGMYSYPVFLLFDKDGVLLDYFTGYSSDKKEYFKKRIISMTRTTNDETNK